MGMGMGMEVDTGMEMDPGMGMGTVMTKSDDWNVDSIVIPCSCE